MLTKKKKKYQLRSSSCADVPVFIKVTMALFYSVWAEVLSCVLESLG